MPGSTIVGRSASDLRLPCGERCISGPIGQNYPLAIRGIASVEEFERLKALDDTETDKPRKN